MKRSIIPLTSVLELIKYGVYMASVNPIREVEGLTVFTYIKEKSKPLIKLRTNCVVAIFAVSLFRSVKAKNLEEQIMAIVLGVLIGYFVDSIYQSLTDKRVFVIHNRKYLVKSPHPIIQRLYRQEIEVKLTKIFKGLFRTELFKLWKQTQHVKERTLKLNELKSIVLSSPCIYGIAIVLFDSIKKNKNLNMKNIDLIRRIEDVLWAEVNFIMLEDVRSFERKALFIGKIPHEKNSSRVHQHIRQSLAEDEAFMFNLSNRRQLFESEIYESIFYSTTKSAVFNQIESPDIYKQELEKAIGSKISDVLSLRGVVALSFSILVERDVSYFDVELELLSSKERPEVNYLVFQIQDDKFYFYDSFFSSRYGEDTLFQRMSSGLYVFNSASEFFTALHYHVNFSCKSFSRGINVLYYVDPAIETIHNPSFLSS